MNEASAGRFPLRATLVWLLLVILTIVTYGVGKVGLSGMNVAILLLISVFIKGHFVIADFMGLRSVKLFWRMVIHGWLIVVNSLIATAYFLGVQ